MPDYDFSQFFNPSAWSWAPQSWQGLLSPQVQNSPTAPSPGGVQPAASPFPNTNMTGVGNPSPTPAPAAPSSLPSPLSGLSNLLGGGSSGSQPNKNLNSNMANLGMQFLKGPQIQAPPLQMAKPVGPVQLQNAPGGGGGAMGGTPFSTPFPNTNMTGMGAGGNPFLAPQLGMLGGYHF